MADKKYVQKGLFHKVLAENGKEKPELPEIYSFQTEKGGFYIKRAGSIITPKLIALLKKDVLPENHYVGETVEGLFVRFDANNGNVSQKYVEALAEGAESTVVTQDDDIVKFNDRLGFEKTGYVYVSKLGEDEDGTEASSFERSLATGYYIVKKGQQFGIMNKGEIVCPPEFYTSKLELFEENGFFLAKSSDKQILLHRGGRILLTGTELYSVMSYSQYHRYKDSGIGQIPYYASYDKNTDSSTLFGYDWACNKEFLELETVPGRVMTIDKYGDSWLMMVTTEKKASELVSMDGDIRVGATGIIEYNGKTNVPYAELISHQEYGKNGVINLTTKEIAIPAKFFKIKAVVQDEMGTYRAIASNANGKFGIVDQNGSSVVHCKYDLIGLEEIPFGKDGTTHFVAKFSYTTNAGTQFIYVDPESPDGMASELAIKRYRIEKGELSAKKETEEEKV
ncbi:MAG: hypothetical protein IJ542_00665 [Clostridia bacterium]|nr:hypothetical protein [Clostridia bacterium]